MNLEAISGMIVSQEEARKKTEIMNKLQTVLFMHPYSIKKQPNGRWNSNIRDANGKLKNIKTSTYEKMIDRLYDFYMDKTYFENITPDSLFETWLNYKKTITESPNTIKRHKQHYVKYFQGSDIFKTPVTKISGSELNSFCNELVKEFNLTSKEWMNIKIIITGIFGIAMEKGYISSNPTDRIKITVRFRQVNKKRGKIETFDTEERDRLNNYLDEMYRQTKDSSFMAVRVNLYLGLRVGELVALKWEDVGENYVHIYKEEIRDQDKGEYEVVDHTKTNQDREVILINKAKDLLSRLRSEACKDEDYIFTRDGKRLQSRQINYVLEKYAERTGTVKKSSHKLRKTYASILQASGVPIDEIRQQLGHSSLETTMSYIFNPLTEQETIDRIEQALN